MPAVESSHIRPDIDITTGDFCRSEEDVSAVTTRSVHSDRVLAAVCGCAVKSDLAALVAVLRVNRPCRLVPSAFEVIGDLAK